MKIITRIPSKNPSQANPPKLCLAIGAFDGVHLGHQAILKRLRQTAKRIKGRAAVFTFISHPQTVLHPRKPVALLSNSDERFALLKLAGIQLCYLIKFTRQFSKYTPEAFVRDVLVKRLNVHTVAMGFDARFGHKKSGNRTTMRKLAKKYGFHFYSVGPMKKNRRIINSTAIRQFIQSGELNKAKQFLGRYPTLIGHVVHGASRGKTLGYPTANINLENAVLPPNGVYAVKVDIVSYKKARELPVAYEFSEQRIRSKIGGVLNIGFRPTFERKSKLSPGDGKHPQPVVEVFLLNIRQNLYGKILKLHLIKYLRKEQRFLSPQSLSRQISKDVVRACKYLG